ncbi:MAG: methyltransferase family protein [Promethearchaeota archaeon]
MSIDFIPLIIWSCMMAFFVYWLIKAIKIKVNYEVTMSIALIFYFSASILSFYFNSLVENIFLLMIGIIFISLAVAIFISQIIIMKKLGKGKNWEYTQELITKGWFKYIRHPIYFASAIGNIGILLMIPTILTCILAPLSIFLCLLSSFWEEKANLEKFGREYEEYKKNVRFWGIF